MVSPNDILREINERLAARYPGVMVYINLCPKDFARPCFLVECVSVSRRDANRSLIEVSADYTVTCFLELDDYRNADTEALLIRQSEVSGLFRGGFLRVGDRAVKVQSSEGGMNFFETYVDISVSYFDDRDEDYSGGDDVPLMEKIFTQYKE